MTPLPKGVWDPPLVRYVFHPAQVSVLCFSCTKFHNRADQMLFWRGPKISGRARSLVLFPPPIRLAPSHITAQVLVLAGPKAFAFGCQYSVTPRPQAGDCIVTLMLHLSLSLSFSYSFSFSFSFFFSLSLSFVVKAQPNCARQSLASAASALQRLRLVRHRTVIRGRHTNVAIPCLHTPC